MLRTAVSFPCSDPCKIAAAGAAAITRMQFVEFLAKKLYNKDMSDTNKSTSSRALSLIEAMHLQEIEGSPLDSDQKAMFVMFERENWDHERRIAHIRNLYEETGRQAAE